MLIAFDWLIEKQRKCYSVENACAAIIKTTNIDIISTLLEFH